MPETTMVSFQIPTPLAHALKLAGQRRGWSRSEWMRRIVLRGLEGEQDAEIAALVAPYRQSRER